MILKYVSLVLLVIQYTSITLLVRYTRKKETKNNDDVYLPSTVVLFSEIIKLLICIILVWYESGNKCYYTIYYYQIRYCIFQ